MEVSSAQWYTTAASLVIVAVLGSIMFGLPWLDQAVSGSRRLDSGTIYVIGGGIEVRTPSGAYLNAGNSRSGTDNGTVVFTVHGNGLRYAIAVTQYTGALDAADRRMRRRLEEKRGIRVAEAREPIRTTSGVDGYQGTYLTDVGQHSTAARSGRYAVFRFDRSRVVEAYAVGQVNLMDLDANVVEATFKSFTSERAR